MSTAVHLSARSKDHLCFNGITLHVFLLLWTRLGGLPPPSMANIARRDTAIAKLPLKPATRMTMDQSEKKERRGVLTANPALVAHTPPC